MKVYSVIIEQVQDYSQLRLSTNVFSTLENAKKFFNAFVDDEIKYFQISNGDIINRNETCFEAYCDGSWSENHSYAEIIEEELDNTEYRG
jgi:hypothetical protein